MPSLRAKAFHNEVVPFPPRTVCVFFTRFPAPAKLGKRISWVLHCSKPPNANLLAGRRRRRRCAPAPAWVASCHTGSRFATAILAGAVIAAHGVRPFFRFRPTGDVSDPDRPGANTVSIVVH